MDGREAFLVLFVLFFFAFADELLECKRTVIVEPQTLIVRLYSSDEKDNKCQSRSEILLLSPGLAPLYLAE